MSQVDLKSLIGHLNETTRRALEAAAGLCLSRTHYKVEIEHWLLRLVEEKDSDLPLVEKHLAEASADVPSFEILLRGTGTFRPVSEVVFVMLATGISQCEQLAERLRSGPLESPLNFPYHPHVTVAHDVEPELLDRAFTELADFTAYFTVSAFSLYRHEAGTGWQPTREFPLR